MVINGDIFAKIYFCKMMDYHKKNKYDVTVGIAEYQLSIPYAILKRKNKNLKVGVLGCMAERLKSKFLDEEKIVDLVVGPDAYKDIPNLLKDVASKKEAVNVLLSQDLDRRRA